jgi:hypothetical protein
VIVCVGVGVGEGTIHLILHKCTDRSQVFKSWSTVNLIFLGIIMGLNGVSNSSISAGLTWAFVMLNGVDPQAFTIASESYSVIMSHGTSSNGGSGSGTAQHE